METLERSTVDVFNQRIADEVRPLVEEARTKLTDIILSLGLPLDVGIDFVPIPQTIGTEPDASAPAEFVDTSLSVTDTTDIGTSTTTPIDPKLATLTQPITYHNPDLEWRRVTAALEGDAEAGMNRMGHWGKRRSTSADEAIDRSLTRQLTPGSVRQPRRMGQSPKVTAKTTA